MTMTDIQNPTRRMLLKIGAAAALAPLIPAFVPGAADAASVDFGPLTLASLKLRSEFARDILVRHFGLPADAVFLAEAGDSYHGLTVVCDCPIKGGIHGCGCQFHPLAGTPMTGGMSGYESPEWDEESLLANLQGQIQWTQRSDKPDMTDAEWAWAVAVAGVEPFDRVAWDEHMRQEEAEYEAERQARHATPTHSPRTTP